MRVTRWFCLLGVLASSAFAADSFQTLDLKPFLGTSSFQNIGADYLLPHGRQVLGGVPFQIDGDILLYGSSNSRKAHPGSTNVNNIPVAAAFERLYLLGACQNSATDGTLVARIRLNYTDDSTARLDLRYGEQVRNWWAPWHRTDSPLKDSNVHQVWWAQFAAAAAGDNYLRLFSVALTNPSPDKVVRSLSLESGKRQPALFVAALTIAPAQATPEPNTWAPTKAPYPDLGPRTGESVSVEGFVRNKEGGPLAGAVVIVTGVRDWNATSFDSSMNGTGIGKETNTDAQGHFTLPPLPVNKSYRLLAGATGYELFLYSGVDPKSDPVEIRLPKSEPAKPLHKFAVRGKLIGPDSKPVTWATIEPDGVSSGMGSGWGGETGFPQQTFSDTNGDFAFSRDQSFTRLQVRIAAPGLAPAMLWLPVSNATTTITLDVGAELKGRLIKDDKPVAGVKIGVVGSERNSEVFAGNYVTTTDEDGRFSFGHLPAGTGWNLFGIMSSLKPYGSIGIRPLRTPAVGSPLDVGDIDVQPSLQLSGKVQVPPGESLPKGLKLTLGYENAWDSQSTDVQPDGSFKFDGLGPGQLTISIDYSVRTWRLAGKNRSIDLWNSWRLVGMLEEDKHDLVLAIEKGERLFNNYSSENGQLPSQDWPQNKPLAGAEPSGAVPIVLAGRALDDKTGEPLRTFKIIPGYKPPSSGMPGVTPRKPLMKELLDPFSKKVVPWNERPYWQFAQAETFSNGNFTVDCLRLRSTPMLRVEAAGYLPFETDPMPTNTSTLVVRLKHGEGPNGVVLLPNGKPAEGAKILYGVSREQFSLSGRTLGDYSNARTEQKTDKNGHFAFAARPDGSKVFASNPEGWAEVSLVHGVDDLKIRLEPWASLKGTLTYSNGSPASGVTLAMTRQHDWQSGDPLINIQGQITTDSAGHFQFLDVPSGRMEVQRVVPMGGNGWTYVTQTWLIVQPGITNDLGKVTYDTPPPPPVMEQLKSKLGL